MQDGKYARELIRVMSEAGQVVPPELQAMQGMGGGFGGGGGGRCGLSSLGPGGDVRLWATGVAHSQAPAPCLLQACGARGKA